MPSGLLPGSVKPVSARLDSWKAIATHFGRDVRTVRRWEAERNLPIHRLPGRERSGVFAYVDELEQWRHSSNHIFEELEETDAGPASDAGPVSTTLAPAFTSTLNGHVETHLAPGSEASSASAIAATPPTLRKRTPLYIAGLVLILAAFITTIVFNHHRAALARAHTGHPNPDAHELYLQGRYYWERRTEPDLTHAVDLFTQSIVHDPKYAAAYSGLADSYVLLRQYGHMPDAEAFPRALAASRQAVALDDSSPEAHLSYAFVLNYWSWDFPGAEREFKRAIQLNPQDPLAHHWYASALASQGRSDGAVKEIDLARSLDPQSVSILSDRALFIIGSHSQESTAIWHAIEQSDPNFASAYRYLGDLELVRHHYTEFLAQRRRAAVITGDRDQLAILDQSDHALRQGGPAAMLNTLAIGFGRLADRRSESAFNAAHFFAWTGNYSEADRYLERSFQQHESSFLSISYDGAFDPLRSTPEFRVLIAKRAAAIAAAAGKN